MRRRSVTSSIWPTKCSGVVVGVADQREVDADDRAAAPSTDASGARWRAAGCARRASRRSPAASSAAVVGVQQLVEAAPGQLVLGPARQLAQRAVRAQQRAVRGGEHQAHGGALERAGEALLGLAQRAPGARRGRTGRADAGEARLPAVAPGCRATARSGTRCRRRAGPRPRRSTPITRPSPVATKRAMPARCASR